MFNFTHDDGEAVVMKGAPGLCRSKDRGGEAAIEGFRTKRAIIGWQKAHLLDPIFLGVEESGCLILRGFMLRRRIPREN